MSGPCSPRGSHGVTVLALVWVCCAAWLGRVGAGLAHYPPYLGHLGHPGHAGPLTVVRHAPPAVPPYSTQVNIFRWLAAFPPPVLHRALLLTQGHPLHPHPLHHHPPPLHAAHHPVLHHAPPPAVVPAAPVLPPPPPPLVPTGPAVVRAPVPVAPPAPLLPLPLSWPTGLQFPSEALPFPPSILPASAFLPLPGRGVHPAPLTPTLRTPFHAQAPLPNPTPFGPAFNPNVFLPSGPGLSGLLPGAFGAGPLEFDFGLGRVLPSPFPPVPGHLAPVQPTPVPAPAPTPTPASLSFHDDHLIGQHLAQQFGHHVEPAPFRQYLPATNGITRATAGNLAL